MQHEDIDAVGTAIRYRICPLGADPSAVANMLHALAQTVRERENSAVSGQVPRIHEVLVPAPADVATQTVLRRLKARIRQPLPAAVDVVMQTTGSTGATGATGAGRLVGLSTLALTASAHATNAALGGDGQWIIALPMHHIAGLQMLTRAVVSGIPPILALEFDPQRLERAIRRATRNGRRVYLSLVPTQLVRLMRENRESMLAAVDAVLIGGAAIDETVLARARAAGINIVTTYGMTETSGGCVYNGMPLPGTHVAVVNDRVWLTGPTLMEGYVDGDMAGVDAPFTWANGKRWLRTSDRGVMRGAQLQVLGRFDDVINTGGIKVDAGPIARAVRAVPGVADAEVVGIADPQWGQVVAAAIVPQAGVDPQLSSTDDEANLGMRIRLQVAAELGRVHAPRVVFATDKIPLLGIGKVDRQAVQQAALDAIAAGQAWVR